MKTVRRNVTLNESAADNLEKASDYTGRSQSELLETALYQPIMQRLWAFICPEGDNPLVWLLEAYQSDEGHMAPRIGENILRCVKEWVTDHAVVKEFIYDCREMNEYIAGHMTRDSMRVHPYFKTVQVEANTYKFIDEYMEPEKIRKKVLKYINMVISGPNDRHRMGESYHFRNILTMLEYCFNPPTKEEIADIYEDLSDGYVLPYHN